MAGMMNSEFIKAKKELLADVFALKAGMGMLYSLDSQKNKIKNQINVAMEPINKQKAIVDSFKQEERSNASATFNENHKANYHDRVLDAKSYKDATKNYFEMRCDGWHTLTFVLNQFLMLILIWLLLLTGVGVAYVLAKESVETVLFNGFFHTDNVPLIIFGYLLPISLGLMLIGYAIFYGCYGIYYTSTMKKLKAKHDKYHTNKSKRANEHAENYSKATEASHKKYLIENTKLESMERKIKPTIDGLKEEINQVDLLGQGLFNILEDTFAPYIAVDDWKNIDYIIYLISTNRADNIKEALNYIDNEERFEELLDKMEEIGENIHRSISNSYQMLKDDVSSSVSRLSTRIADYNNQLESHNSKMVSIQKERNELLSDLGDSARTQNDLLREITKSDGFKSNW